MQPTVGRIVHYQARGSADGVFPPVERAAIITEVDGGDDELRSVGLAVFHPDGLLFARTVPYAETPTPGCWSWPPRV